MLLRHDYTIEYDHENHSKSHPCDCCGNQTTNIWAFVSTSDGPHSVYHFAFVDGHEFGTMVTMVGGWGGGDPADRRTACFDIAMDTFLMYRPQPLERHPSPFPQDMVGRVMTVYELMEDRSLAEVFYDIARVAYAYDKRFRSFLQTGRADLRFTD